MSQHRRALPPARAPPPFDPPVLLKAERITGTVLSHGGSNDADNDHLLRDSHILLITDGEGVQHAFLLQRKIGTTGHGGSVRVGFQLQKPSSSEVWEIVDDHRPTDTKQRRASGMVSGNMVEVTIQEKARVVKEDGHGNSTSDTRDPSTELSVLQLVAALEDGRHVLESKLIAADQQYVYSVITPYHKQGSLFERCAEKERLNEGEARFFFRQILQGLETLQRLQLCHRNLTLDSVLVTDTPSCDIAGLGSALRVPTSASSDDGSDDTGTILHLIEPQPPCASNPQYVAPELLQNQPFDGYAVDLWSAGVMLFAMLVGTNALFVAPIAEDRRFQEICVDHGDLKDALQRWGAANSQSIQLSEAALDLLQKMLRAEPTDRLSLSQVQQHAWVTGGDETDDAVPEDLSDHGVLGS